MFASLTGPFIILLPLADNNAKQNFLAGFYVLVHFAHTYTNSLWSLQLKVAGTFWQLLSAAHAFIVRSALLERSAESLSRNSLLVEGSVCSGALSRSFCVLCLLRHISLAL